MYIIQYDCLIRYPVFSKSRNILLDIIYQYVVLNSADQYSIFKTLLKREHMVLKCDDKI